MFALETCPHQPSQLVRDAQVTARGRRMPSTRGTMPRHASESSRQQGASHGKVAGRLLGAPLRVEKGALYELIGGMHNDLLTSNKETRLFAEMCRHPRSSRVVEGWVRLRSGRFDWTVQVGCTPPLTKSGVRRRVQEKATRLTIGFLEKTLQRQSKEAHRFWDWISTRAWGWKG